MKTIREVLLNLYGQAMSLSQEMPEGELNDYLNKDIDQALKDIQKVLTEGLPKKRRKKLKKFPGSDVVEQMNFAYNQYRQEAIEGIKRITG